MALSITSENAQLLHVSDVVLSPLHLENPTWVPIYDMMSAAAARSKQLIFDRAAEENALVFAHHFPPFPNLGYVFKHENAWGWRPIELST
jgi:glyoxylase-like metal-dependent hydrolase (beta-lactamase superfamily II)